MRLSALAGGVYAERMFAVWGVASLSSGALAVAEPPPVCETRTLDGGAELTGGEDFSLEIRDGELLCAELRPVEDTADSELRVVRRSSSPTFTVALEVRPDMGGTLLRVTNQTGEAVRIDVRTEATASERWTEEDSLFLPPWKTRVEVYPGIRKRVRLTIYEREAPSAAGARVEERASVSVPHLRTVPLDRFAFWLPVLGVRSMDFSTVEGELESRGYASPPGSLVFGGGGAEVSYGRFAVHLDLTADVLSLREGTTGGASRVTSIRGVLAVGYDLYNFGGFSVTPFVGIGVDETNVVTLRDAERPPLALVPGRQDVRRSAFLGQLGLSTVMHLWAIEDERDRGLALALGFRGGYTHQFGEGTAWRTRSQSELQGNATFDASGAFFQLMLGGSFFLERSLGP